MNPVIKKGMLNRITNKVTEGISGPQFEDALSAYAGAVEQESKVLSLLEAEMKRIRDKYNDELTYLQTRKKSSFEIVQTYCREQKPNLFAQRRSIGTRHGVVGFRLGTPKLQTLRGVTWQAVLDKLKEKLPGYVRTSYEPAKDQLIADRHVAQVAALLPELGIRIVQDESFYVEIKKAA